MLYPTKQWYETSSGLFHGSIITPLQKCLLSIPTTLLKSIFFCFQVFKPPNPWTIGIMNVLAELHQEPELKLNLKFEIEVLCKTLNLELAVGTFTHSVFLEMSLCVRNQQSGFLTRSDKGKPICTAPQNSWILEIFKEASYFLWIESKMISFEVR